ncbi:DMT family transporter [Catelliglobosispora koreensis]|uniref:DMT family transporter n=1 Tax=Catelliglobosispora koreensis TaxID=129052 RepID=UPI00146DFEC6|nr:DMT family transporter [Catelliglobosispora koreensis]
MPRLALLGAVLCWGGSTAVTKYALGGFPPMTLLLIELVVANLILWPLLIIRKGLTRPDRLWRFALLGFFEPALAYAGLNLGLVHTTAANAALLASLEAVFVVLLAVWFLRERMSRRAMAGVALAAAGVAVLQGARPILALELGDVLIAGGALSAAIYVVMASRMASSVDPITMTCYQFGFGLIFATPVVASQWLTGQELLVLTVSPGYWITAILAGTMAFVAPFLLYNYAITVVHASTAGMALNLIPVFGVLAAVIAIGERLTAGQLLGAILIVGGLMMFTAPSKQASAPAAAAPA